MPSTKGIRATRSGRAEVRGLAVVSIETPSVTPEADREGSSFRAGSVESLNGPRSWNGTTPLGDDERPVPVKLSILMAAYNEERTIARAVHGILQASFPCEVELIVVDRSE